jgi:hypothetical protein
MFKTLCQEMGAEYEVLLYHNRSSLALKRTSFEALVQTKGRSSTFSERKETPLWNTLKERILSRGWPTWQIFLTI